MNFNSLLAKIKNELGMSGYGEQMWSVSPAAASGGWVGSEPCHGGGAQGLLQESSWSPAWQAGGLRLITQPHQPTHTTLSPSLSQLPLSQAPAFSTHAKPLLAQKPGCFGCSEEGPMSQGRDHTGQERSGPEKKNAGTLLRQLGLLSQPCQGQARRCSGKAEIKLAQKGGRLSWPKEQERRLEGAMDTCP